ncbi:MAG: ceramidase domain-containing protein [Chitinophagales bacterium]
MNYQDLSQQLKNHFHLSNHRKNAILHPIWLTLGVTLLLVIGYELFKYVDIWQTWMIAKGNTFHFCEMNKEGMIIKQSSNTWSNLGYLLVGFILLSIGIKDHLNQKRSEVSNLMAKHPGFTILLSVAVIWLFIGSFFYHASLTRSFQKMDVTGIFAIWLAIFFYNIFKIIPTIKIKGQLRSTNNFLIGAAIVSNILFFTEIWKWNINIVLPIMMVMLIILKLYSLKNSGVQRIYKKYIFWSAATMFAATSLWLLDRTNVMCSPTSVFQGHALWHILTALAILFIYFYYRTEEFSPLETAI